MIQPCKSVVSSHMQLTLQTSLMFQKLIFLQITSHMHLHFFFQRITSLFIQQILLTITINYVGIL